MKLDRHLQKNEIRFTFHVAQKSAQGGSRDAETAGENQGMSFRHMQVSAEMEQHNRL